MSVGPTSGPYQRPSVERDLMELFQRVGDLERIAPPTPPPTGIQFDTSPQVGGFLEVSTTTVGPSTYGIYLRADVGSLVTPGILLSSDGYVSLASNHVVLGADSEIDITTTVVEIGAGTTHAFYPRQIRMNLANNTGVTQGSKFAIYGPDGVAILEVRDDVTFHIKTGGAWVADLP